MVKTDDEISFLEKRVKELSNETMNIKEKNEEKNTRHSQRLGL